MEVLLYPQPDMSRVRIPWILPGSDTTLYDFSYEHDRLLDNSAKVDWGAGTRLDPNRNQEKQSNRCGAAHKLFRHRKQ